MKRKSREENIKVNTKKLADEIASSQRSVQRWLFEGENPSEKFKKKINSYLGEEIFRI